MLTTSRFEKLWTFMTSFDVEFVEDSPKNILCGICAKVMIAPHIAPCGCQFCFKCIKDHLEKQNRKCSGNKENCGKIDLILNQNVSKNFTMWYNVASAFTKCPEKLCGMKVKLEDLEEHMEKCKEVLMNCPFRTIGCTNQEDLRETMDTHLTENFAHHSRLLMDALKKLDTAQNHFGRGTENTEEITDIVETIEDKKIKESTMQKLQEQLELNKLEIESFKQELAVLNYKEKMKMIQIQDQNKRNEELSTMVKKMSSEISEIKKYNQSNITTLKEELTILREMRELDQINHQENAEEFIQSSKEIKAEIGVQKVVLEDLKLKQNTHRIEIGKLKQNEDKSTRAYTALGSVINICKTKQEQQTQEIKNLKDSEINISNEMNDKEKIFQDLQRTVTELQMKIEDSKKDQARSNLVIKKEQESQKQELKELGEEKRKINTEILRYGNVMEDVQKNYRISKVQIDLLKDKQEKQENRLEIIHLGKVKYEYKDKEIQDLKVEVDKQNKEKVEIEKNYKILKTEIDNIKTEQEKSTEIQNRIIQNIQIEQENQKRENKEICGKEKISIEEFRKQKELVEELQNSKKVHASEIEKLKKDENIRYSKMLHQIDSEIGKYKTEMENQNQEFERLRKWKTEIIEDIKSHKVLLEEIQKNKKVVKKKLENLQVKNKSPVSEFDSVIREFKMEQEKVGREVEEIKVSEKNLKGSIEKQRLVIEELKKNQEKSHSKTHHFIPEFHIPTGIPHFLLHNITVDINSLKTEIDGLKSLKDLKKKVIQSEKDIVEVRKDIGKVNETVKTVSSTKVDKSMNYDFIWTISDFSQKSKTDELMSDTFYKYGYRFRLNLRLDGYNVWLSLCLMNDPRIPVSEWSSKNEVFLGIINQQTLQTHLSEKTSYDISRNKCHSKKCDKEVRLCIGGPCIPHSDIISIPGLLVHDSVMIFFSLLRIFK